MPEQTPPKNLVNFLLENTLSPDEMDFCIYALNVVYGWKFDKVKKFKINTVGLWIKRAKKRMTAENLMSLHMYIASKGKVEKKTLWKRLLKN